MSGDFYREEFAGRVALVTGGASGIGSAVAERLASGGAIVVVADCNVSGAEQVASDLRASGTSAAAVELDVADPRSVQNAVDEAVRTFGGLHLAVNSAGISGPAVPTDQFEVDAWRAVLDVNLSGVFYSLRSELPAIEASGGGAVVNIASMLGSVGIATSPAYVAAKHGVVGLTKTAALDFAERNVRINAVGPGFIDTPMISKGDGSARAYYASQHPLGRLGTAGEVAEITAFLLSERASFVHGSYHLVDGGYTAR